MRFSGMPLAVFAPCVRRNLHCSHVWPRLRWSASLIADAGGFGVGSDLTWQVFAGIAHDLNKAGR
jgi:hypothetical protein